MSEPTNSLGRELKTIGIFLATLWGVSVLAIVWQLPHPPRWLLGASLLFRRGEPGESYESLRGPFNAEAKPLLADEIGPIDTPITGSLRVKVGPDSRRAWLVAYLPRGVVRPEEAARALRGHVARAPAATISSPSASTA
mgnify:CR=1 FL=1